MIKIVKACNAEAQRKEYGILLRSVAPTLLKKGDSRGMVRTVANRLKVPHGHRAAKGTKTVVP